MLRLMVRPTLAMIYPQPKRLRLAGQPYRVLELRLRNIATIERRIARLVPHPYMADEAELRALHARSGDGKDAMMAYNVAKAHAQRDWPPTLNSASFRTALATTPGAVAFLDVVLRRTNPGLSSASVASLACQMDADEWGEVQKAAWGLQEWEVAGVNGGDDEANDPQGEDWAKAVEWLVSKKGMNFPQAGALFITQYYFLRSGGEPREACLPDWPTASASGPGPA